MEITLTKGCVTARADSHGAELFSYIAEDGRQVLWGGSETSWPGRSPVLFPIVGAVANNSTRICGTPYPLTQHGFARHLDYEIAEQSEDSVTFMARANEETRAAYPFEFALFITHKLTTHGFITSYRVENTGDVPMHYCIGGHTGFCCPMADGNFEDFEISWPDKECVLLMPYSCSATPQPIKAELLFDSSSEFAVEHSLFDLGTLFLMQPQNSIITLQNPKTGIGVRMEYEGFPVLAMWSKEFANAPFICLEPWHGMPDMDGENGVFEEKHFSIALAPGESRTHSYEVTVLGKFAEEE